MLKSFAAAALGALCVAAPLAAQTITFDPFPGIPSGVAVRYFQNTRGVLGALPTPLGDELIEDISAVPDGGSSLLLSDNSELLYPAFEYGALFTFDDFISSFSAIGNDFGGDVETVYLTAFDAAGNVLASTTTLSVDGQPNLAMASIAAAGIRHVAFTYSDDLGFYAVDNVAWRPAPTSVPEPASYALLGAGLLALVGARGSWRTRG